MKKYVVITALIISVLNSGVSAESKQSIKLLKPQTSIGKPLMQALKDRSSSRDFSTKELSEKDLSNLLWAAWGINRDSGLRTAPSARNWQEIDVYVAMAKGLYLYNAEAHTLELIISKDIRKNTGQQAFVQIAPINLIYVADYNKMNCEDEEKKFYSAANTAFISQNVYLYCASEGLATVIRGLVDRKGLAKVMKLKKSQHVVFSQTVGYPTANDKK
ncbi:SagB/ThcOx family dehydrogenase [bacterium]|nr:SagB/ThcOx family dehydrogenase [bacterium]